MKGKTKYQGTDSASRLRFDWITIALYVALVVFGWVNIYAACYSEGHKFIFDMASQHGKQLLWIGISAIVAFIILYTEPRVLSNTAYFIYVFFLGLLLVTLVVARAVNGGHSWIDLGPFKLQPSEFAKFATALALAKYAGSLDVKINSVKGRLISLSIIFVPAVLILLQHDTGSALVFSAFVFPLFREGLTKYVLLFAAGAVALFVLALVLNKFIVMGIVLVVCIAYLFLWLNRRTRRSYINAAVIFLLSCFFVFSVDFVFNKVLEPHQRERIDVLLGKTQDFKGVGYNVHQSKIAIGSGGFFGKGFLKGTITKADFVPEQETDFIFCTVGEEGGFIGSATLVILYVALLLRLVKLAERQRSTFARFYGYSVVSILFIHFFINIGMVLGLVPVIGIPLPFFSYGGSSLLAFSILLFVFIKQDTYRAQLL
ncbi:MAG: rod shape-determining protein RodA [Bacteroidales bacterium]|nr:rod shape-determining protein RodA [Bacteroidales bacterium]